MATMKYPTMAEFYRGRNIFITGATGFMGKVMLEKLLRSCPDFGRIYLLMRSKKGQAPKARLDALLANPVFEKVRLEQPAVLGRLRVVSGDVSEDGLGIDDAAMLAELHRTVEVVFHFAACVRFDMTLKHALEFNTKGTKRVLELSQNMKNLEAFIYVSTSYCHCEEDVLEEKPYDPPYEPNDVIEAVRWMRDDVMAEITPKLIGNLPNTYAFSKSLTEKLVTEASRHMPVAIARPSIVSTSWQEPMPGYLDNLNGPAGMFLGAGMGVLRSMHCNPKYLADLIPCDLACNGILAVAWELANNKPASGPLVVNLTTSELNPVSWGDYIDHCHRAIFDVPFSGTVWWPGGSVKASKAYHDFCFFFGHICLAYFIDGIAFCFRQKPFMVNIQRRLQGGLKLLQYYTTKEWRFNNKKIVAIRNKMSPAERKCFNTDVTDIKWDVYGKDMLLGIRHYVLKDKPSTLPKARKHMNRLYYVDKGFQVVMFGLLLWLIYSYFDVITRVYTGVTSLLA